MAARFARAHRTTSARARRGPSEASVKFFDETFFQKSFDLALALTGRAAHKRKLGKQRSAFPERRRTEKTASRSPLRHAKGMTPPPKGEARLGSPFGGAVAVRRLRGQPASASTQPMRGSRWQLALSVLANASPLSPAGSGDAAQWAAPITDRRGSGDRALNGAHWAPAPPKGGGETWLPPRGSWHGASRD